MSDRPANIRFKLAFLLALAATALLAMSGCVSPGLHQGVPDDFSLDAAVLPARGSSTPDEARHFVLHADGSLRAGRGRQGAVNAYPGRARQLSTTQVAELLSLSRQAIAAAPQGRSTAPTQWLHEPPPETGVALLLWVRDSGTESAARFDGPQGDLPPLAELIRRRLHELALMR